MQFGHRFQVEAPHSVVLTFHLRTEGLALLTPPPARVELHRAPAEPVDGDRMEFTIWFGPLPVPWTAQFSDVSQQGFTDTQVRGPFAHWEHRHWFRVVDEHHTEIVDVITARLGISRWTPVALAMWLSLPLLFRYRVRATRRLLEAAEG